MDKGARRRSLEIDGVAQTYFIHHRHSTCILDVSGQIHGSQNAVTDPLYIHRPPQSNVRVQVRFLHISKLDHMTDKMQILTMTYRDALRYD